MKPKGSLLAMIEANSAPVGMQCFTGDHTLMEVLGRTGFDYVWLDSEHSVVNPRALEDSIRTADVAGLISLVRIPEPDDTTAARRALEAGADGLILPMVRSAADIREILDALENIEEICALPEIRLLCFAAGELAFALGEGSAIHSSSKVRAAHQRVKQAAARHGVALMGGPILDPTPESCARAIEDGIRVFCLGIDVMAFRGVCERTVKALDTAVAGTDLTRPAAPPSGFPDQF